MEKVNYIIHLNAAFEKMCNDERLTPFHISLYFSLFHYWNISKFRNPISISRDEMMNASKIGSVNTYIRCIKELHTWHYIQYKPSFNPQKGSQVYLFIFNKAPDKANHKTKNNAAGISESKTTKNAATKTPETPVIPSINSLNKTNKLNSKNEYERKRKNNNPASSLVVTKLFVNEPDSNGKRKKVAPKKELQPAFADTKKSTKTSWPKSVSPTQESKSKKSKRKKHPSLSTIQKYFTENNWPSLEAQKFFNYYQGNGWLVGGKVPMQSWKACASNWMINSEKFNNSVTSSLSPRSESRSYTKKAKPGKLHTTNNKNYGEPL